MAQTLIGVGDPKAAKVWSTALSTDVRKRGFFSRAMEGVGEDTQKPIRIIKDLQNQAGTQVTYQMSIRLQGRATTGDNTLKGREESLVFSEDTLFIDQVRHAVTPGGKMAQKNLVFNMRKVAKARLKEWFSDWQDQAKFAYASGARGVNADFIEDKSWTGFAGNPLQAPDDLHLLHGGSATSKGTLTAADKMSTRVIDSAVKRANTLASKGAGITSIAACEMPGSEPCFVMLMHPWAWDDFKNDNSESSWLKAQQAAAGAEGQKNALFTGAKGSYNGCAIHTHTSAILFDDYGAGNNVSATRSLLLGRQALTMASGSANGNESYSWKEEKTDYENQMGIAAGGVFGIKKPRFKDAQDVPRDFGVISIDVAAQE